MRIVRLLSVVLSALLTALLLAPVTSAEPPFRIPDYVTDNASVLSDGQRTQVQDAVDQLYNDQRIRLWVVYVDTFGQGAVGWARTTMQISDFGDQDALLAIATEERAYAFQVPSDLMSQSAAESLQRNSIEPALRQKDWTGAALAAVNGLNSSSRSTSPSTGTGEISWVGLVVVLAIVFVVGLLLWLFMRRRKRKRREAEFAAARRVDPADPNALAAVSIDALDDLSKAIVVDVDNAVRTSESELALAVLLKI